MNFLIAICLLLITPEVMAADFDFKDGGDLTIEVDQHLGSVIELPFPVKVIPATRSFEISAIETELGENGAPINITIINVKPLDGSAVRETVPIIFDGKRSLKITFVSRAASDRHHRIRATKSSSQRLKGFLERETYLMIQMLKDEEADGYKRQRVKQRLDVEGYKQFDLYLVRKYMGSELNGYTFQIINKTEEDITINPTAINFAAPNRAALLQMDSETLVPCKTSDPAYKPKGPCASAIRVVIRGESYNKFGAKSDLPFFLKPEQK